MWHGDFPSQRRYEKLRAERERIMKGQTRLNDKVLAEKRAYTKAENDEYVDLEREFNEIEPEFRELEKLEDGKCLGPLAIMAPVDPESIDLGNRNNPRIETRTDRSN